MKFHMSIQDPIRFYSSTDKLLVDFLRSLTAKHKNGSGLMLVAEIENENAGFIYADVEKQNKELKKTAYKKGVVHELFVNEHFRGHGVAQALMKETEKWLVSKNCKIIILEDVHAKNYNAQNLYKKLGYIVRVMQYAKSIN
jgi:GNAT superfamily N-acetyltransferase